MAGVSLVGFSGSLIKDSIKYSFTPNSVTKSELPPEPIDTPEATTVLVGKLAHDSKLRKADK
jgi:hypothetical protein